MICKPPAPREAVHIDDKSVSTGLHRCKPNQVRTTAARTSHAAL
jgi:hypothetical protein